MQDVHVACVVYISDSPATIDQASLISYPVHPERIHILRAVALLVLVLMRRLRRAL